MSMFLEYLPIILCLAVAVIVLWWIKRIAKKTGNTYKAAYDMADGLIELQQKLINKQANYIIYLEAELKNTRGEG